MTGEGSDRPDKGKGVARTKKRQRQAPKYVLRVPTTLPTPIVHSPPSSTVHPSPTSVVHPPPTPTVHLPPTPTVHPSPSSTVHPPPTPTADPLPPPVIITPTPPPDPTFIPSSSSRPPSETATASTDLHSAGDDDGVDPPPYDRPWIEPYGKGFLPSRVASQAITHRLSNKFRNKSATAQRNRASEKGGTLHTGGSITIHEHVIRMALERRDQEITDLRADFTNFKALVMSVLPQRAQDQLHPS
ncbi:extensin-like [Vigna radiata var. radiata]|uniref:Extensin-like n=1 Tax=Vigna radiata var. radiata TaxID=3916 RepID=A0A1S3UAS6_VIGRR|nr:extensin-like [Vigna radiata var. radiata]